MPEWNKLPREMQEMVVQRSTKSTRNSLRSCSKNSKLLVEGTRLRSLHLLGIHEKSGEWILFTAHNQYQQFSRFKVFATFEELQENLIEILKLIDCIENFIFSLPISTPQIKLSNNKDQRRLLVESVSIDGANNIRLESILSQIEPVYSSVIILKSDAQNPRIYDMEQVVGAEILKVNGLSCIREDQLLKLNAYEVSFEAVNCSIYKYVKKCALDAATKFPRFSFGASKLGLLDIFNRNIQKKIILDVSNSKLKFEIAIEKREEGKHHCKVSGSLRYGNESNKSNFWRCDRSGLRILPYLRISYKKVDRSWNITIKSLSFCLEKYQFQKFGEFQEKLDEIMDNVDFIKDFSVQLTGSNEEIKWKPREKQLMVKELSVEGDRPETEVHKLLENIDPKFKLLLVYIIFNPYFVDQQVLPMNHFNFSFKGADESLNDILLSLLLTEAGINQSLKNCVRNVGKTPINFTLNKLMRKYNFAKIFDGLDILEVFKDRTVIQWVINSHHSDYVMNARCNFCNVGMEFTGFVSL